MGTWRNLTNGPFGIAGIPKPVLFGMKVTDFSSLAVLSVLQASVCALVIWLLVSSPWGRLLKSTRDDELAARGLEAGPKRELSAPLLAAGIGTEEE